MKTETIAKKQIKQRINKHLINRLLLLLCFIFLLIMENFDQFLLKKKIVPKNKNQMAFKYLKKKKTNT